MIIFVIIFGGMISIRRSESINAFIKIFVSSHTCLIDFVKHVDFGVQEISQRHMHTNMVITLRPTSLKTKSPLEEQVFQVFTTFGFKKFQEKITRVSQYSIIHIEGNEFIVRYFEGKRIHLIESFGIEIQLHAIVLKSLFPIYMYDGVLMHCMLVVLVYAQRPTMR
ncbi:hypothetical protein GQ457_01G015840 [Hibiscus cannabinus]